MIKQSMSLKMLILPLSLALSVILAIFFVKPYFSEMTAAKKSLVEKQAKLDELKKQTETLQQMKSKWEALGDDKTLVGTALPEVESVDAYLSEISSKASRSGVLLSDIKLDQQNSAASNPAYICGESPAGTSSPAADSSSYLPASAGGSASNAAAANPASSCLRSMKITMAVKGSWEQMLDFFKYLEDMNRLSNTIEISISSEVQVQGQAASDLLTANISTNAFFEESHQFNDIALVSNLVSQGGFSQKSIDKLKNVVYSLYTAPSVSPGGERNLFK